MIQQLTYHQRLSFLYSASHFADYSLRPASLMGPGGRQQSQGFSLRSLPLQERESQPLHSSATVLRSSLWSDWLTKDCGPSLIKLCVLENRAYLLVGAVSKYHFTNSSQRVSLCLGHGGHFIHPLSQQLFSEQLLCARNYARCW